MLGARDPREHDPAYMGWISKLPCAACMVKGKAVHGVHVAHLRAGSLEHGKRETGKGEKPSDRWTTPLCPFHHINGGRKSQTYYPGGEEQFWADHGICPFALCLALVDAYVAGRSGSGVVARFAAAAARELDARP